MHPMKQAYLEAKAHFFEVENVLCDYFEFLKETEPDEAKLEELYLARHYALKQEEAEAAYHQAEKDLILWGQKITRQIPGYEKNPGDIELVFAVALDPLNRELAVNGFTIQTKLINAILSLPE